MLIIATLCFGSRWRAAQMRRKYPPATPEKGGSSPTHTASSLGDIEAGHEDTPVTPTSVTSLLPSCSKTHILKVPGLFGAYWVD